MPQARRRVFSSPRLASPSPLGEVCVTGVPKRIILIDGEEAGSTDGSAWNRSAHEGHLRNQADRRGLFRPGSTLVHAPVVERDSLPCRRLCQRSGAMHPMRRGRRRVSTMHSLQFSGFNDGASPVTRRMSRSWIIAPGSSIMFWPGVLIVEQKSAGRDLNKAKEQAGEYFDALSERDRPRYILVSDFRTFELRDLDERQSISFPLVGPAQSMSRRSVSFSAWSAGCSAIRTRRTSRPRNWSDVCTMRLRNSGYRGHDLERFPCPHRVLPVRGRYRSVRAARHFSGLYRDPHGGGWGAPRCATDGTVPGAEYTGVGAAGDA